MNIHFLSINPLTNIPSLRFIIDLFIQKKWNITISEIHLKSVNNYLRNKKLILKNIAEFNDYNEYKKGLKKITVTKYLKTIKWLLFSKEDIIYTNDYQVVFLKLLINTKARLIYHQFELIDSNYLGKFSKLMFHYVLKNANRIDLCIFPEKNRAEFFISNSSLTPSKSIIIPNTCSVANNTEEINKTVIDFIPDDYFKILHVGSVGANGHFFTTFLNATNKFTANDKTAFIFIGRKTKEIDDFLSQNNFSNVHFIETIPHEELLKIYPKIDLGIILYKGTNLNFEFCAPNKLYEFWSNGIPVLAHQLKGLIPLFTTDFLGELTDFNDEEKIVLSITKLKNLPKENKLTLTNYFKKNLDVEIYISLLEKHIYKLQ
ncbi:MAG: hypothetical protein OQJ96_06305 [Flavobacteriales bacterium]|nr:hypothetical protein [Flavobacteriales bacterium]MCW8937690.1 hypothetical protein [Flavobacteriales bacterium]MCW8969499.1 hypothetical protein [Flavobacteriales bacterium]MCW8990178.1 hypothetical protein [Flavobacteriales bacterium]MCW9019896.1 hypothetical protein [Flavobacteriales bacterium]